MTLEQFVIIAAVVGAIVSFVNTIRIIRTARQDLRLRQDAIRRLETRLREINQEAER